MKVFTIGFVALTICVFCALDASVLDGISRVLLLIIMLWIFAGFLIVLFVEEE